MVPGITMPSKQGAEMFENTENLCLSTRAEEITEPDKNISIALLNSLLNTKSLLHWIRQ